MGNKFGFYTVTTTDEHLFYIWKIMTRRSSELFLIDPDMGFEEFKSWYIDEIPSSLTGFYDDEIIGCAYLDSVYNGHWGYIHICIAPDKMWLAYRYLKDGLKLFMLKHDLRKIIGVSHNETVIKLMRHLGFEIVGVLKEHIFMNDKWYDCSMGEIMRKDVYEDTETAENAGSDSTSAFTASP